MRVASFIFQWLRRLWRLWLAGATLMAIGVVAAFPTIAPQLLGRERWTRKNPLVNPIAAIGVLDGVITLADGRRLRPAGVRPKKNVSAQQFDAALAVMVAQGVVVEREFEDGRAFMVCEPKFYNWCGTMGYDPKYGWGRWAGGYFQCPLSVLLILAGSADAVLDEPGLNGEDRWRFEGATVLEKGGQYRQRLRGDGLRFSGSVPSLARLDDVLADLWKAPPNDASP